MEDNLKQIFIFGDSLAYGAYDREGGWTHRLRKHLDNNYLDKKTSTEYFTYNLAIPTGITTKDLLKNIEPEIKARISKISVKKNIIIVSIGVNDSAFLKSKNSNQVKEGELKKNLEKIILKCKKFTDKIIFVGSIPFDEGRSAPIPWNNDMYYITQNSENYNNIMKSVCIKKDVMFIDLFGHFKKCNYRKLLEDGLHPNTDGHRLIFEVVKDFLMINKII